jgi:hypothetical protein
MKILLLPIYTIISTISLWILIGIHIIFPVGYEFIYNVINSIFIIGLVIQLIWGYNVYKQRTCKRT